jgi:hypothetical protein
VTIIWAAIEAVSVIRAVNFISYRDLKLFCTNFFEKCHLEWILDVCDSSVHRLNFLTFRNI